MKITKYSHSCLLVEMPAPINRTALFDPGMMSESVLDVSKLAYLDDIIITHKHGDHFSLALLKQLVEKFPNVSITAPAELVAELAKEGITASDTSKDGIELFDAPHEPVTPLFETPEEIGVHYLHSLTHPGDSHSFTESKAVLALPVTAPWGSTVSAVRLAMKLKPKFVLPIHDWHWSEEARALMYGGIEQALSAQGITFIKLENGVPVVLDLDLAA
jgi:L-ascorbate metabolism protein UlaG (beta-lactamase superfamily)